MKKSVLIVGYFICLCLSLCFGGSYQKESVIIEVYCGDERVMWSDRVFDDIKLIDDQFEMQKNGRMSGYPKRVALLDQILNMGFSCEEACSYVFPKLNDMINKMANKAYKKAVDATLKFTPNKNQKFVYTNEKNGQYLDKTEIYQKICQNLHKTNNIELYTTPKAILPKVSKKSLKNRTQLASKFETDYSSSGENRKNNISLAVKSLNGLILEPNKVYSFNELTGKRTKENGYKEANIIINNEYIEGFGGGVCQVSTTLYNALILADIEIVESHSHSLESHYVMAGFDAMVNFGSSDLKFKNTKNCPQYIYAFCDGQKICIEIYSKKLPYKIIRKNCILSETKLDDIVVEDHSLFLGEKQYKTYPKTGKKVKSFLEYSKGGKVFKTKELRTITYKPVQGVLLVGTKKNKEAENRQTFSEFQTIN